MRPVMLSHAGAQPDRPPRDGGAQPAPEPRIVAIGGGTGLPNSALERLGLRAIGVPLVSEHPAGKVRHHPERLAAAIAALAQGKLGAWRHRAEVGGL